VFQHAAAVTPSDGTDLATPTRAIFVGGAGTLTVITAGGETVLFTGVIAGQVLTLQASRIKATGTTATNIVAMW